MFELQFYSQAAISFHPASNIGLRSSNSFLPAVFLPLSLVYASATSTTTMQCQRAFNVLGPGNGFALQFCHPPPPSGRMVNPCVVPQGRNALLSFRSDKQRLTSRPPPVDLLREPIAVLVVTKHRPGFRPSLTNIAIKKSCLFFCFVLLATFLWHRLEKLLLAAQVGTSLRSTALSVSRSERTGSDFGWSFGGKDDVGCGSFRWRLRQREVTTVASAKLLGLKGIFIFEKKKGPLTLPLPFEMYFARDRNLATTGVPLRVSGSSSKCVFRRSKQCSLLPMGVARRRSLKAWQRPPSQVSTSEFP